MTCLVILRLPCFRTNLGKGTAQLATGWKAPERKPSAQQVGGHTKEGLQSATGFLGKISGRSAEATGGSNLPRRQRCRVRTHRLSRQNFSSFFSFRFSIFSLTFFILAFLTCGKTHELQHPFLSHLVHFIPRSLCREWHPDKNVDETATEVGRPPSKRCEILLFPEKLRWQAKKTPQWMKDVCVCVSY